MVVNYIVEICRQVSSCRHVECRVLNYLSHANVIYGDYFITSNLYFLGPTEDRVPSCITYVFRHLSALFLWVQLVCEGLYIQILRQFFGGFVYPYIEGLLVVCTVSEVDLDMQDGIVTKSRVLSTRIRTQEYRPAHLNQPPIQYIQRGVLQYADIQTPQKLTQNLNIQAFTN